LPEGRTRYLSPTELKTALETAADRMPEPIALAGFTGMRRGELLGLQWKDVDMDGRRVYLRKTLNSGRRNDPVLRMLRRESVKVSRCNRRAHARTA
jgi:integrase